MEKNKSRRLFRYETANKRVYCILVAAAETAAAAEYCQTMEEEEEEEEEESVGYEKRRRLDLAAAAAQSVSAFFSTKTMLSRRLKRLRQFQRRWHCVLWRRWR